MPVEGAASFEVLVGGAPCHEYAHDGKTCACAGEEEPFASSALTRALTRAGRKRNRHFVLTLCDLRTFPSASPLAHEKENAL